MNIKLENTRFLKITELYAFIAKEKDGSEGLMAFQAYGSWIPMVGADLERVDILIPIADKISRQEGFNYEIRYFKAR